MRGKEDMESGSGSEQLVEENQGIEMESNNNNDIIQQNQKKKRYHRHTARQIQEMEAYISLSLFFFCLNLDSLFKCLKNIFKHFKINSNL